MAHSIIPHKHQCNEENRFYIKSEKIILSDIPSFLAGLVSQDIGENHLSNYKQPENSKIDYCLIEFILNNIKIPEINNNQNSYNINQYSLLLDDLLISKGYTNVWNYRGPPSIA